MAQQIHDGTFAGVRLPTTFSPIHYDLSLEPNFKDFTFEGKVKIDYTTADHTTQKEVVLHANELVISEGLVYGNDSREQQMDRNVTPLSKVIYSPSTETATLQFDNYLPKEGTIDLKFRGTLNDKMKGFYRTAFKLNGTMVYAATTQFEATDARRCFPCWDEPAIKATFTVSLTYERSLKAGNENYAMRALSNMPEVSCQAKSASVDSVTCSFQKTPIMSTYLLAFVVGPFDEISGHDGKRPIRVFTTPGKQEQGRFSLEVACKSLPYYENYFNIDYPLPKMDLIAIPDFAAGAMENWGLVTYRETCLLVDPANTSTDRKQWIALVVAHELAHQWFGNLVTMEWWTHLWLNEGFASFMEFLCVDHIFPEYDIWSQFVTDSYARALDLDSLHNSHPIEVPVKHPSEIDEIFDDISYNKGASVIRMLYNYIGDESFRKGMKDYLTKFAYKNAFTEDLWESLEKASDKPVCKLMSGWTSQKGFPWLAVSCAQDGDTTKLTITQNKFTADGTISEDEANVRWMIPVAAINGSNPAEPKMLTLLEGKSAVISVEGAGDSWTKLNPGTVGLYRTAYPGDMSMKLWPAISDKTLPAMDRLGIQNDFFALCKAGKVSTVDLLKLLRAFKNETNYTVWNSIDSCLGRLSILLANTDYQSDFYKFGIDLFEKIFERLGWEPQENEKHTDVMTRALIINRLVSFGEPGVISDSKLRYKLHLEKKKIIPADLRGAIYRAVSAYGDEESFKTLFEIYRTAELHEEKDRAARALGFIKDPQRLQQVLEFVLSDEVRNQDKVFVIIPIGIQHPAVAWKLIQDHKDMLREKYESGFLMSRLVKCTTENFATEERAQEIAKFFEDNKFPGTERTVQQSIETIRLNSKWLERDSESVKSFLSS